jgi:hypothetical protein
MGRLRAVFWDIVANIGGLAGILALAYPILVLASKPSVQQNPDIHELVVFTLWILGLSFAAVITLTIVQWSKIRNVRDTDFLRTEVVDLKEQQRRSAAIFHNLAHDVRNQILHLLFAKDVIGSLEISKRTEVIERIERNWGMFNLYYLDNLKALCDSLTGQSNAVCIKVVRTEVVQSQPEPRAAEVCPPAQNETVKTIKTLYRDTISNRLRRENDIRLAKYVATSNSAFAKILSDDTKDYFFLSNDLQAEQSYVNTNPRWREFYNAAMVSPIRIENFSDPVPNPNEKYITYGFICVDSLNGKYRKDVELEILQAFCDLYFPLLYSFDAWRKSVQSVGNAEPPNVP